MRDRVISALVGKKPDCLTHYVSVIYRDIPDIFAAVDRAPKGLQGDRKSFVYASK